MHTRRERGGKQVRTKLGGGGVHDVSCSDPTMIASCDMKTVVTRHGIHGEGGYNGRERVTWQQGRTQAR